MNIKKTFISLALFCLIGAPLASAAEAGIFNRRRKADTAKVEPKKTPYQKFIGKKDLKKAEGFATIYRSGEKFYLEIPDSLVGRRIIFSNVIADCSDPRIILGTDISENTVYEIAETDSMVLFLRPKRNLVAAGSQAGDSRSIASALDKSNANVILAACPIRYRNGDSTAKVIDATKLFSYSDKRSASLKDLDFGDYTVTSSSFKSETSRLKGLFATSNSVGIDYEAEFELGLQTKMIVVDVTEKPFLELGLRTAITLIPDPAVKPERRKSDPQIGVRTAPYTTFSADGAAKDEKWALRWDTCKPITIYVDTLFSPTWANAIRSGIEAWLPAFDSAGIHNAIKVLPYPAPTATTASSSVATDPLSSTVQFAGQGTGIGVSILTDPVNARILSCRITVPKNYIQGVRRSSVYSISDVDPRYQDYFLSDDAVCEVLKAQMIKAFSVCLGLVPNAAGSNAYTPAQLRDPQFTAAHGITASVTDDVLFNYIAVPGDKERGVATIVDRLGAYDIFAVKCLYGSTKPDAAAGHRELTYVPYISGYPDPRLVSNGLGDDNVAAFDAALSHLKFVADNADKWLADDRIPGSYRELFLDWIWIAFYNSTRMLSSEVGALVTNEVRPGSATQKYETVPAALQKQCISRIFEEYRDIGWLQQNKALLHIAGANKDVSNLTMLNLFAGSGIDRRLPYVEAAHRLAGSPYTSEQYLDDLRSEALKEVRKGDLGRMGEDVMVTAYLNMLVQRSPVLKRNYSEALAAKSGIDFRMNPGAIPAEYAADLEGQCYEQLEKALADLRTGRTAARSDYDRRRIDYLIDFAEAALGKHRKANND